MSFLQTNLARSSVSYNTDSFAKYTYKHPTDTIADMLASGYFQDQARSFQIDDVIDIQASDGNAFLQVTALLPNVTTVEFLQALSPLSNPTFNSLHLSNLNGAGHIVSSITPMGQEPLLVDSADFVFTGGQLGVGTAAPIVGSLADFDSTTGTVVLPRMTTAERDLISPVADGSIIYNTTLNKFQGRENGSWLTFTLV